LQNRRKDGSIVWVLASVKIVRDDEGNVLYHEGTSKDITEIRQTQEALRLSEVKYRQLHESMMDGFVSGDLNGYGVEANEAFLKMLGYSSEELRGLNYKVITPKKWHAAEEKIVKEQLLPRGYSDIFEKEYIRKDGTVFPVELRTTLRMNEKGQAIGFWSIVRDITERKKAERALSISEKKYRDIFNNSVDGIYHFSPDGRIIDVNPAVARILGYSSPEELMNSIKDLESQIYINPDDSKKMGRLIKKDGFFNDFELKNRRKDGSIAWVLTSCHAVRDEQGNVLHYQGSSKDITEMKHARDALFLSERKYRQLHESIMDGYANIDTQGRIMDFNKTFIDMLGYSPDELRKLTFWDITPQNWHALEENLIQQQLQDRGYSDVYEKEYIRKDGTIFPVELRTAMLKDASGKPICMWAIVRDITERKQQEEALKKSEEAYRLMLEDVTGFIALVDKRGIVQKISNSKAVLGYEEDELNNINSISVAHPDEKESIISLFREGAAKKWREIIYQTKVRHKDGHYLDMEIRARNLNNSNGEFIGNIFTGRLINKRQEGYPDSLFSINPRLVDHPRLTDRENEILRWVMEGKSTWDIAQILNITERTVKFHVDNIMKKFNAVNRAHAVAIALSMGIAERS